MVSSCGAGYMVNSCQSGAFVRVLLGIGSFFKNIGHGISEQRHSLSLPTCVMSSRVHVAPNHVE